MAHPAAAADRRNRRPDRQEMHDAARTLSEFKKGLDKANEGALKQIERNLEKLLAEAKGRHVTGAGYQRVKTELRQVEHVLKGMAMFLKGWDYAVLCHESFLAEHQWERSSARKELAKNAVKDSLPLWVETGKQVRRLIALDAQSAGAAWMYRMVGKRVLVLWRVVELPVLVFSILLQSEPVGLEIYDIAYRNGWDLEDGQQVIYRTFAQIGATGNNPPPLQEALALAVARVSIKAQEEQDAYETFEREIQARRERGGVVGGARARSELN